MVAMIIIGAKDGRKKEVAKNRRHIWCLLTYKQQKQEPLHPHGHRG